jgi:TatA/E family protein of Tat protein translocase
MSLPSIGPLELIIILAIALLIVGPKRLPEMGNAFGRTIREFRKATTEVSESTSLQAEPKPVTPTEAVARATPTTPATPAAAPATPTEGGAPDSRSADAEAAAPDRDANDDANRPA